MVKNEKPFEKISKLYMLDNFVHKSGNPTWLANRIRDQKSNRIQGKGQQHCLAHWEILWRNYSIAEKEPEEKIEFNFNDWGVTTVRRNESFLAMKVKVS